jgi:hypothetical protein
VADDTSFRSESSFVDANKTHSHSLNIIDAKAGIGCTLERTSKGVHIITSVKKGGACDKGGIKAGMHMLGIAGANINGMSMKDVRQLSMGPVGSQVKVIIRKSSTSQAEEGTLTRCAPCPEPATYDDRTIATPRGPLQSDRSDRSAGPSWLSRMFRTDGSASGNSVRMASHCTKHHQRYPAPEDREMQLQAPGRAHNGIGEMKKPASRQRTADGRLIEYDKNGQVGTLINNISTRHVSCVLIQTLMASAYHHLMPYNHCRPGSLILRRWRGPKSTKSSRKDALLPRA